MSQAIQPTEVINPDGTTVCMTNMPVMKEANPDYSSDSIKWVVDWNKYSPDIHTILNILDPKNIRSKR